MKVSGDGDGFWCMYVYVHGCVVCGMYRNSHKTSDNSQTYIQQTQSSHKIELQKMGSYHLDPNTHLRYVRGDEG